MSSGKNNTVRTSPVRTSSKDPIGDWAILNWIKKTNQRSKVWAILPVDSLAVLPQIDPHGYWEEFRRVNSKRFPEFDEAKQAIQQDGFYFTRESVAIGALNEPRA